MSTTKSLALWEPVILKRLLVYLLRWVERLHLKFHLRPGLQNKLSLKVSMSAQMPPRLLAYTRPEKQGRVGGRSYKQSGQDSLMPSSYLSSDSQLLSNHFILDFFLVLFLYYNEPGGPQIASCITVYPSLRTEFCSSLFKTCYFWLGFILISLSLQCQYKGRL